MQQHRNNEVNGPILQRALELKNTRIARMTEWQQVMGEQSDLEQRQKNLSLALAQNGSDSAKVAQELAELEIQKKELTSLYQFLQTETKRVDGEFAQLITDKTLIKKVRVCRELAHFEALVEENEDLIDQIAALILLDHFQFQMYFISRNHPHFFLLLKKFPPLFREEVKKVLQRWESEKSVQKKAVEPHAFRFDDELKRIIQEHHIQLINPYKKATEDQDPVFIYLSNSIEDVKFRPTSAIVNLAIQQIKKDERFVHPITHKLNAAGRAITNYAKRRVTELEEKEPSFINKIKALFSHIKLAYLAVYGFDGYDVTKHKVTSAQGTGHYEGVLLPFTLVLASFLGLPTRAAYLESPDSALPNATGQLNHKPNFAPILDFLQIGRNFIGGWIPIRVDGVWEWTEKKRWQVLALPIKIFIILPLKLATLPFKLALNILKLCTELLPALALDASKMAYEGLHQLARIVYSYDQLGPLKYLPALLLGLAALAVRVVFLALNIVKKFGIALTSPEKSAKMAFVYGRKFVLGSGEDPSKEDLAFALGVFLGFVSILTSAILWAIFLPVALSALLTYIPVIPQALTWVLQSPVVGSFLGGINNALLSVGTFLGTASTFGGAIAFLAGVIGIQVSASFALLCSASALLAAPLCAIFSRIADDLSNGWARWDSTTGLLTSLCALCSRSGRKHDIETAPLLGKPSGSLKVDVGPSKLALREVLSLRESFNISAGHINGTQRRADAVEMDELEQPSRLMMSHTPEVKRAGTAPGVL